MSAAPAAASAAASVAVEQRLEADGVGTAAHSCTFSSACFCVVLTVLSIGIPHADGICHDPPCIITGAWRTTGVDCGSPPVCYLSRNCTVPPLASMQDSQPRLCCSLSRPSPSPYPATPSRVLCQGQLDGAAGGRQGRRRCRCRADLAPPPVHGALQQRFS